jgi:hypothetical protein
MYQRHTTISPQILAALLQLLHEHANGVQTAPALGLLPLRHPMAPAQAGYGPGILPTRVPTMTAPLRHRAAPPTAY